MKEEDKKEDLIMEEDLMEKGKKLYVTSVTIMDILQRIVPQKLYKSLLDL